MSSLHKKYIKWYNIMSTFCMIPGLSEWSKFPCCPLEEQQSEIELQANNRVTQRRNKSPTCRSSLYEESRLGSHRTLFKHLHHSSMSSCSHWLLVHLQDQVSLYQARRSLWARIQHLHLNNTVHTPSHDGTSWDWILWKLPINTKRLMSNITTQLGLD